MEPSWDCRVSARVPEPDFSRENPGFGGPCVLMRCHGEARDYTKGPWAVRHHCIQDLGQAMIHVPVVSECALRAQWHADHMSSPGLEKG